MKPARSGSPDKICAADLPSESMLPLWRRINGEFFLHGHKWNMSPGLAMILIGLHRRPDVAEPSLIAQTHYLPRQTTTFLLDTLEKKGLAARKSHPTDRRRKIVQITPKGAKLAAAMFRDLLEFEAAALKELDATDLAEAKRLLTQYADALALINQRNPHP
jgi:DNA-binding MarR family transcriptional regulator